MTFSRMRPGAVWAAVVAAAALAGSVRPVHARETGIQDLRVEVVDAQYRTSFRVEGAFPREVEERIASGLETSFRHRVRLYLRRGGWLDVLVRETVVTTTVNYDSLTRQYTLSRLRDGRLGETGYTGDPEEMRRWMTEIRDVSLGPVEGPAAPGPLYVKVKSNVSSRFFLFFIPVRWNTDWEILPVPALEEGRE